MTSPAIQPATKYNELIDRLSRIDSSGINEIELKAIERDAKAMAENQAIRYQGLSILGMVEMFRFNYESASDYIRRSISCSSADWRATAIDNQLVVSRRMGRTDKVMECAELLLGQNPDNIEILTEVAAAFSSCYAVSKCLYTLNRLNSLNALPDKKELIETESIFSLLKRNNIQEDEVINVIRIASSVFEKRKILIFGEDRGVMPNGESFINFWINETPETAAEINWMIADKLSEQLDDTLDHIVTVGACSRQLQRNAE